MDLIYIALILMFLGLSWGLIKLCDLLLGGEK
jgi:hypothetical protein